MSFRPIVPKDYPTLKPFFKNQRYRLCAYSLPSVLAWRNNAYQPYGKQMGETLLVSAEFPQKPENRHLILPVSPTSEYPPEALQDLAIDHGFEAYWWVSEEYLDRYGRSTVSNYFEIEEQAQYADYIYLTEDLATLKGNRYSKKRNLINQFQREYVAPKRVAIEAIHRGAVVECIGFLEKWCAAHDCDATPGDDLDCEKQAAINTFEHFDILGVNGILARIDGEVCAFGVASHLTDDMGVLHFEKAEASIQGLYQFFDNQCAKRLFKGYRYINKESDMSLPGLAKAKKSYHPVMKIRCYKLIVR